MVYLQLNLPIKDDDFPYFFVCLPEGSLIQRHQFRMETMVTGSSCPARDHPKSLNQFLKKKQTWDENILSSS